MNYLRFFFAWCAFMLSMQVVADHGIINNERPMVVVICSRNNSAWCERNLASVFAQEYSNYRVIYIDDASTDGMSEKVQPYLERAARNVDCTFIKNEQAQKALANHYRAIHLCKPYEIIVHLDGDDWFKHNRVLQVLNNTYKDPNVWLTYGSHEIYPSGMRGQAHAVSEKVKKIAGYRESRWITHALRSFYAGLARRIALKDLLYEGAFFPRAYDLALLFPMLEMAHGRIKYIDEILYVYNQETPQNDFKVALQEQMMNDNILRGRKKYTALNLSLEELLQEEVQKEPVDVVLFSQNNPLQARNALKALSAYATGVRHVMLVYQAETAAAVQEYEQLAVASAAQECYGVTCLRYGHSFNLRIRMIQVLDNATSAVVLMRDTACLTAPSDLAHMAYEMNRHRALTFRLDLGGDILTNRLLSRTQKQPVFAAVPDDIFAWQCMMEEFVWKQPFSCSGGIYQTALLASCNKDLNYRTVDEFERCLQQCSIPFDSVALCGRVAAVQQK